MAGIRTRPRWVVLPLAVDLAVVGLAGCHHRTPTYSPSASVSAPGYPETPRPTRLPARAAPRPQPPSDPAALGRPVSSEVGLASWYGPMYHNHAAADGSLYDQNALTVAHRTLPLGTTVRVTNVATGQSILARVTDRGPFVPGRTIDLSLAAAKAIDVYRAGVAQVKVEAFANPTADPAGRWCVQVGVFIDPADAIQLKNDLTRRYTNAKVIEFTGPTGHWVRINPLSPDRLTATRIADSIHLPDAEPYLVRLN